MHISLLRAFFLALLMLLSACATSRPLTPRIGPNSPRSPVQQALRRFVDSYLEEQFRRFPLNATAQGVHAFDSQLKGFTAEEQLAWAEVLKQQLAALPQQVDRRALPPLDQADYDILESHLKARLLELEEVRGWERNPSVYLNLASNAVYGLISRDFLPLEQRMRSAVARMGRVPEVFAAGKAALKNPPRIWTEIALQQAVGTRALYADALPQAFASIQDPDLQASFQKERTRVLAAVEDYVRFLREDLLPRSQGDFALGEPLYRRKLLYEEGVQEDIARLLEWGSQELRRTQEEFREVAHRLDARKTPVEVYRALGDEHPAPEQLVPTARATLEELRRYVEEHELITLPSEVAPHVAETPSFNRSLSFASLSPPGAFETHALVAYYYVTPPDPTWSAEQTEQHMSFYNRHALPLVSIHEVYPGHYVQLMWAHEVDSKVRRVMGSASFIEGWGLYCEQMMLEAGYGGTGVEADKLKLNQLALYLLRLARYQVGLSLHTRGMTYEQAVRFFEEQAYMTHTNAEREARRGTSDPTYLVYALGKKLLLELREEAHRRWGADFTLQRFHDAVVSYGYPPVPVVRRLMFGEPSTP